MSSRSKYKPTASPDLQDRIAEAMLQKFIGGGGSSDSPDAPLPDSCGECRFFHKAEGAGYGRCYRNPPDVPEPLFDEAIADVTDFGYLRPPVFPEDTGCGEGEKGF